MGTIQMDGDELCEAFYSRIKGFAAKISSNYELAEDIAQETFTRAYANQFLLSRLSDAQKRAWLFRTAQNLYTDWLRSNKNSVQWGEIEEDFLVEKESFDDFHRLVTLLPDLYASVLILRYELDLNSSEISQRLKIPAVTVRRRLQTARALLKSKLDFLGEKNDS
ncbi:MAG: RNA polymerase sigma factor [Bdellovibrionota bacterium]